VTAAAITVGLVADDLTGAADSVATFARAGWLVELRLAAGAASSPTHVPSIVATTSDARAKSSDDAAALTREAVTAFREAGAHRVYVKVDSTMRGSVSGQIDGALAGWRPDAFAVVCPAYPEHARTVVDGHVMVDGTPLASSPAAHDPVTPVDSSTLSALLPGSVHVAARGDATSLADDLVAAADAGSRVLTVDAASTRDLAILADAIALIGGRAVAVGSAGLASALRESWTPGLVEPPPPAALHGGGGSTLVIVSSLHSVARGQLDALTRSGLEATVVTSAAVVGEPHPDEIAEQLAGTVVEHLGGGGVSALVLVGGDGARATLWRIGATAIRVLGEVSHGVPFGVIVGGPADGLAVVTKSGGFGGPSALVDIVSALTGAAPEPQHQPTETETTHMTKPVLALTLGDVAGIGPEITAKTLLLHPELRDECVPIVIGDVDAMRRGVEHIGLDPDVVRVITDPRAASNDSSIIELMQTGSSLADVETGVLSGVAGDASYRFVVEACALAKAGKVDAIVTAPLNKAAMHEGGHDFPGHTELLAHEFGVKNYSLVLSAGDLYFFHLTTHVSLRNAIDNITPERTDAVLTLAGAFTTALGRADERIGVCGLNPHAGENRIFGDEDADILEPAVARARERGVNAVGPLPADALIPAAVKGKWNIVVACYHDQGHAPFKAVYGDDGVNITVGLPVVRVSVDHGTAFDIAGTGIAREASLVLSCRRAAQLAPGWDHVWQTARANEVAA
jgi:4-hydroxythreonine-4-phosphate dehydrogenase